MAKVEKRYVLCLSNEGYQASLERMKLYAVVPDDDARAEGMVRVIDESGEDYLYAAEHFAEIELPREIVRALAGKKRASAGR